MFTMTDANQTTALQSKANNVDVYIRDVVYTKAEVNTRLQDKEPWFYTAIPLMEIYNAQLGRNEISLTETFLTSVNNKRDATQVDAQIVSKLAGAITPSKIEITNAVWPQIKVNNTSTTNDPCEIMFSRQSRNTYLACSMGVSGDTARGAFWWAGGSDRININCETGLVKINVALETPVIQSNIIKGLSTTTLRIEDNVVITGNATINGTITASNSNPFWIAGKVAASGASSATLGRYSFSSSKVATGQYTITPNSSNPFPNANYTVQLTIADKIKLKNNESIGSSNDETVAFYGSDDTVDIHANTFSIMNDLLSFTQRGTEAFDIVTDINCVPFKNEFPNALAGWVSTFELEVFNQQDICLYPNLLGTALDIKGVQTNC